MPYNFPIAPGAYNWWEGDNFRIPALGQYARPVYADALQQTASTDPTMAQALPQAVDPRAISGSAGDGSGNHFGQQPTQQAQSFGQFARAMTTGPLEAAISLPGQVIANALAGRPEAPINNVDFMALAGAVRDAFTGAEPAPAPTPGPPSIGDWGSGDISDPGGLGSDYSGAPNPADRDAADTLGSSGMYARGGMVRGLLGPNPPGPDDGFAGLDRGEFVVRKEQAKKHRGLLHAINAGKVSKKRAKGLLS